MEISINTSSSYCAHCPYLRSLMFLCAVLDLTCAAWELSVTFSISFLWLRFMPCATVSLAEWPCWPHMDLQVSSVHTHGNPQGPTGADTSLQVIQQISRLCPGDQRLGTSQARNKALISVGTKKQHVRAMECTCAYIFHSEVDDPRNQFVSCMQSYVVVHPCLCCQQSASRCHWGTLSNVYPNLPSAQLQFSQFHPSKTARHMVTGHNGITQQHHSTPGGQNNVKFSSNLTTWLPLSHKWWWSRKLVAATSWAGFVSPLLCLTHSCPLSRTNWQSSSKRATTLSSSISPRPPEHPWEMFLKRIQATFAH